MDVVDQAQVSEEVLSEPMDMQIVPVGQAQQPPPTALDFAGSSTILTRKGKSVVLKCAIALHRSARTNKYDGFKVNQISDNRQSRSRVRARVVPTLRAVSMAAVPTSSAATACPAPTSVEEIQQEGVRCGIPPEDLSAEKLLDGQQMAPSTED